MNRYQWARTGDINAFFGLMLDNVAVMIALVVLATTASPGFSRDFVLTQMIPGTALGVLLGDLVFTWMAFRLAKRTGRSDVTAMPLGLDTPSTFAVAPLVLLPALNAALARGLEHEQAMFFAWHVGATVLVLCGLCKTAVAPFGSAIRKLVPRAGLLGSLAAIALALIAFVPLWQHIAAVPVVGLVVLTIILVTMVAHRDLPGKMPGALAAVLLGAGLYAFCSWLSVRIGRPVVPLQEHQALGEWRLPLLFPDFAMNREWWNLVLGDASGYLPIMLPFALATVVGGIDCTESAAAAGDEFDTKTVLFTEGLASVAAGVFGGVIQTTPYIGQPAYKAMGGRAAYTLATAIFIGVAGFFGWFAHIFEWLPEAALFPILVFVGLEITSQSFKATPSHHYPALALAILPALAYFGTIVLDMALPPNGLPQEFAMTAMQSLRCLANGFIVTSLLWASALAYILDGRLRRAAIFLSLAGVFSLIGVIHSPLNPAQIAWPWDAVRQWFHAYQEHWIQMTPAIYSQSPYHWAGAYGLAAGLLLLLSFFPTRENKNFVS